MTTNNENKTETRYRFPIGPEYSKIYRDPEMDFLGITHLPLLLGITGPSKAGKTMVAKHLVTEKGFYYASLSSALRIQAAYLGEKSPTWGDLGDIAGRLRRDNGNGVLAERVWDHLVKEGALAAGHPIVINGILHPDEARALASRPTFKLIAIDADAELRFRMSKYWFPADDDLDWDGFLERDQWEMGLDTPNRKRNPEDPNIGECMRLAKKHFTFKGIESDLLDAVDEYIDTLHNNNR